MKINLMVHKQLKALDIYGEGINWKELYDSFVDGQEHGIYFYSYNDSSIPYYIGKSQAKSYKIVGRVWDELNDYANGRYWLSKNPDLLADLTCFKKDYPDTGNFFAPGTDPGKGDFKKAVEKLLKNTVISFSYLQDDNDNQGLYLINDVECQLQYNLVKKYDLDKGWVGDGGAKLSKGKNKNHDLHINYTVDPMIIKLDEEILK